MLNELNVQRFKGIGDNAYNSLKKDIEDLFLIL